jgi:ABC-type sugar transport system ATPase subunit
VNNSDDNVASEEASACRAQQPLIRCRNLSKYFGGARALDRVCLELYPGQVVALIGDNGAGKSTLVKILSGLESHDEGELWLGETCFERLGPREARRFGVETVHQNLNLCDNLGAAANVMLGQEPVRFRFGPLRIIDEARTLAESRRRINEIGATLDDLTSPVRRLSGGQRQAIAIARALTSAHRLIMFDEPTAALGVHQTRATLELIRRVAAQGVAVMVISHNMEDIFAVAERVVVLRQGQVTLDSPLSAVSRERLVAAMMGSAAVVGN